MIKNDKDKAGRTTLMNAVIDKDYNKAKNLINDGVNINEIDNQGFTALHFAVQNNDYKMIEYLIEKGANVNIQDKYGNIPLSRAIKPYIDRKIIEILLKSNSDIHLKNNSGISVSELVETVVNFEHKDLFH